MAGPRRDVSLRIEGLRESIVGLGRTERSIARVGNEELATRVTTATALRARRNWASQRIRPSVAWSVIHPIKRPQATIRLRYGRFPYAAGVEFGARRPRYRKIFGSWLGQGRGYVVWPAIQETKQLLEGKTADKVIRTIGRWLRSGR